jgi:tetratricopeptide (TPR) repeat protein
MTEILLPTQIATEAKSAYQSGDYLKAAALFENAVASYQLKGDSLSAAEMANNSSVSWLQAGDFDAALRVLDGVEEIFFGAKDTRHQAMTIGNRAVALEGLKQNAAALQAYHEAAELFQQIGADDLYANTMQALSALQLRSGLSFEAIATMQSGLQHIKKPGIKHRLLKKLINLPTLILKQ